MERVYLHIECVNNMAHDTRNTIPDLTVQGSQLLFQGKALHFQYSYAKPKKMIDTSTLAKWSPINESILLMPKKLMRRLRNRL